MQDDARPVKVAILGPGALGCVFGAALAQAGHDVWLLHRRPEAADALRRQGIRVEGAGRDGVVPVHATHRPADVGPVDVVLVLVKAHDTRAAAESARALVGPDTLVLSLQNGIGNTEVLGEVLGAGRVLGGLTYLGAALVGPAHVRRTPAGDTFVGEVGGGLSARAERLVAMLNAAGLPSRATEDLDAMIWGKLVINASLNPTAAMTGLSAAGVLASESARTLVGLLARETADVATALGIELPFADPVRRVLDHLEMVRDAKPSMLQDVEAGRRTEVDAINGSVVGAGDRARVPTPYNRAMWLLIRSLEQSRLPN